MSKKIPESCKGNENIGTQRATEDADTIELRHSAATKTLPFHRNFSVRFAKDLTPDPSLRYCRCVISVLFSCRSSSGRALAVVASSARSGNLMKMAAAPVTPASAQANTQTDLIAPTTILTSSPPGDRRCNSVNLPTSSCGLARTPRTTAALMAASPSWASKRWRNEFVKMASPRDTPMHWPAV